MAVKTYVLGRDCVLRIDGRTVEGVSDVAVRESTVDVDASSYYGLAASSIVTGRTYSISIAVPDMTVAREIVAMRYFDEDPLGFELPRIVSVELTGGLLDIDAYFTIHDWEADEPLDGAVVPRFEFREWGGPVAD